MKQAVLERDYPDRVVGTEVDARLGLDDAARLVDSRQTVHAVEDQVEVGSAGGRRFSVRFSGRPSTGSVNTVHAVEWDAPHTRICSAFYAAWRTSATTSSSVVGW